jgi:hypothetical protein
MPTIWTIMRPKAAQMFITSSRSVGSRSEGNQQRDRESLAQPYRDRHSTICSCRGVLSEHLPFVFKHVPFIRIVVFLIVSIVLFCTPIIDVFFFPTVEFLEELGGDR